MSDPQDPNQWARQGWQQPVQSPQSPDLTQIAPQYGQQPYGAPSDQTQIGAQYGGQPYNTPSGEQPQYGGGQWGQPPQSYPTGQTGQYGGYPQQPQQPYGQYAPQFGGQPLPGQIGAPKKSKTGLIVGLAAGAVIAIVAIVLLVGWLTRFFFATKFDNAAVNDGVAKVLKEKYNETDVKDVKCATEDVRVEAGSTFSCAATISGKSRTIDIKVLDSDGKYQVGAPK